MQALFIICTALLAVLFIGKSIINVILDKRNGYSIAFARSKGYVYFLPYDKEVSEEDEKLKQACNFLHKASIFFIGIFIFISLIKFITMNG